jgi:hypothetical protein
MKPGEMVFILSIQGQTAIRTETVKWLRRKNQGKSKFDFPVSLILRKERRTRILGSA